MLTAKDIYEASECGVVIGSALSDSEKIQRYRNTDPAPEIPFADFDEDMPTLAEAVTWVFAFGLLIVMIILVGTWYA